MFKPLLGLLITMAIAGTANAAEICGNGVDDDGDGNVDDGCYPSLTTGQCENPLSCSQTGDVSPGTGSLRYEMPADVMPNVPYGLGISFRRYYESQYAPGAGAPAYRKAFGERWGHSYASWLDKTPLSRIILHLPRGQDARFSFTSTAAGWDNYNAFQIGFHFQFMRQRTTAPFEYQLRTLTGETLVYDSNGKLIELWDTLATPNKVLLTYDGSGMLSTVTDASGKRRLLFGYTSSQITSVAFQLNTGSWVTQHTTTYAYSSGNLATVTIGGQLAQTNNYSSSYLTSIVDGNSNTLVSFAYDSVTAGKVVRVDTPRGVVGWEFASSRTECSSKTVLYFHKANTTACSADSDCATGTLCGGKTGPGSTGQCFRGARCLTVVSVLGGFIHTDDLVTSVSAFAGNSEPCDGACLDAVGYAFNFAQDLHGVLDPSGNWTAKGFNGNGVPTMITYGDSNAAPGGGLRDVFLRYDNPTFPGKVTEIRRKSDLDSQAASCSSTVTTGCAQSLFAYNADGLLSSTELHGVSLDSNGANNKYAIITTYTYDPEGKGRLAQIDGPLSGSNDLTQFEYWTGTGNVLKDGFLQNFKRKKDGTNFLTQSSLDFDFWGNAISLQDADGTISCQTFDSARGYLTQRREQMAGQTDCTTNAADLVTNYLRDSALRLTRLTRPDLSCLMYEYDTRGRLLRTKRRDDCNAASSGETEEYTYSAEGLLIKTEDKDASGTVTKRQELTYFDSLRLEKIINPVNTAKWTGLAWEPRGLLDNVAAVDGANTLSKTKWAYDAESRVSSESRYTTSSAFDTWSLLFDWIGNQKKVTDGDAKPTESVRDDLGRVVKLISADLGNTGSLTTVLRVYDTGSRLMEIKDSFGITGQQHHKFSFDNVGRPLVADYHGTCLPSGLPDDEITSIYDCVGTGGGCTSGAPACPGGTSCTNLAGRLAYVKVKLMCQSSLGDSTLHQQTWFGYDAAGRLTHEYISDDNGRNAAHAYVWTKNGALQQVTLPSTTVLGSTYGSATSNSDTDRIVALWRTNTSTPIIDTITYEPFGPLKQYNQKNSPGGGFLRTRIVRNLAYRQTLNIVEKTNGTNIQSSVTLNEDAKGRITTRDYFPSDPTITGRRDSWFAYDLQDRVLCESTTSGTCPTNGTTLKNNHSASPPFMAAGDWKTLLRPIPGSTGLTHTFALYAGTHHINTVTQSDGSPVLGTTYVAHDTRGNRAYDGHFSGLLHDIRTYTYDARRNIINVRGKYFTAGAWHFYNVASAFDAKNRRVFKSFQDETTLKTTTWFFYYDALDRLTEIRHTPDASVSTTYSLFQLVWLGDKPVLYWQTDYPSVTTSKRYVSTDESNRPVDMMSWPASGAAARVWTINPDAWGNDTVLVGGSVFQPLLFAGQFKDDETIAWQNDGVTRHRPGVVLNGFRTYDPWIGAYLQVDPLVESTWSTYVYVDSNPVGKKDPDGLSVNFAVGFGINGVGGLIFGNCWDFNSPEHVSNCLVANQCGFFEIPTPCGCLLWGSICDMPGGGPGIDCGRVRPDGVSACPGVGCCVAAEEWCEDQSEETVTCDINQPDCWDWAKCKLALRRGGMPCSNSCTAAGYNGVFHEDDCSKCAFPDLDGSQPFKRIIRSDPTRW
jgi:RHS repeat-associated protein